MSRIGILTFHRAYNYGAFLQCYSLSKYLEHAGHEVEVIDYTPQFLMDSYNQKDGIFSKIRVESKSKILFFLKRMAYILINHDYLKKSKEFEKERNKYISSTLQELPLSNSSVISDEASEFYRIVDNKYDVVIVGSDAVWNDYQTNCPYFYYLEDVKCHKKISFAASAYGMSYEKKSVDDLERIKKALDKFEVVATRDSYTQKAIESITETNVIHTCDPTLTLDISKFKVKYPNVIEILKQNKIDVNKKIICVMGPEWLGEKVRQAVGSEYQIVSVYTYNRYCDVNINNLNPFEWIVFLGLVDVMVTTFFHGTIFSLKNATPTICVEKANAFSSKHQSKLSDLLERLCLKEFYFSNEIDVVELKEKIEQGIELKGDKNWEERVQRVLSEEAKTADRILPFLVR